MTQPVLIPPLGGPVGTAGGFRPRRVRHLGRGVRRGRGPSDVRSCGVVGGGGDRGAGQHAGGTLFTAGVGWACSSGFLVGRHGTLTLDRATLIGAVARECLFGGLRGAALGETGAAAGTMVTALAADVDSRGRPEIAPTDASAVLGRHDWRAGPGRG